MGRTKALPQKRSRTTTTTTTTTTTKSGRTHHHGNPPHGDNSGGEDISSDDDGQNGMPIFMSRQSLPVGESIDTLMRIAVAENDSGEDDEQQQHQEEHFWRGCIEERRRRRELEETALSITTAAAANEEEEAEDAAESSSPPPPARKKARRQNNSNKTKKKNHKTTLSSFAAEPPPTVAPILDPTPELQIITTNDDNDNGQKKKKKNELWRLRTADETVRVVVPDQEEEESPDRRNNNGHQQKNRHHNPDNDDDDDNRHDDTTMLRRFARPHAVLEVCGDDDDDDDAVVNKVVSSPRSHRRPRRPHHRNRLVLSPPAAVVALTQVMRLMTDDQRRAIYHGVENQHWVVWLEQQPPPQRPPHNDDEDEGLTLIVTIGLTGEGMQAINDIANIGRHNNRRGKKGLMTRDIATTIVAALFPELASLVVRSPGGNNDHDGATTMTMTPRDFYQLVDNRQLVSLLLLQHQQQQGAADDDDNAATTTTTMTLSATTAAASSSFASSSWPAAAAAAAVTIMNIPGLVPTLRPYQSAAVAWMLQRERRSSGATAPTTMFLDEWWKLAWVVLDARHGTVRPLHQQDEDDNVGGGGVVKMGDHDDDAFLMLLHCPFTGWFATSVATARDLTMGSSSSSPAEPSSLVRGGILAESMGLGKTVEVLACILANPSRHPADPAADNGMPLAIHPPPASNEDEDAAEANTVDAAFANFLDDDCTSHEDDEDAKPITTDRRQDAAAAVVVTPDRKTAKRVPEVWMDDDEIGSCICGELICFSQFKDRGRRGEEEIVVCRSCNEPMHHQCAYLDDIDDKDRANVPQLKFRQRLTNATICGYSCSADLCPSCAPEQTSRATLIASPIAILEQWEREIGRHTTGRDGDNKNNNTAPLKVVVYKGIKQLSGARSNSKFMHARCLGDADIVLVSFEALRDDLSHVNVTTNEATSLRRKRRYRLVGSPLTSIMWWRVCLDEAQRVESTVAGAAKVALRLRSVHKWCVTGTPIGRGKLDDLYGLLLFLGVKPFDDIDWFRKCIQSSAWGAKDRVDYLFRDLLWRSTKDLEAVRTQMNVPEQTENKILLKFSSVEKHFYDKQLERTLERANCLSDNSSLRCRKSVSKAVSKSISKQVHMLRAACCHPQVGTRGIAPLRKRGNADKDGVDSRVMAMDQILDRLIENTKLECEEAQRLAIMHTNAMGAITRLMVDAKRRGIAVTETDETLLSRSCAHYLESIQVAEENAAPSLVIGGIDLCGSVGFIEPRHAVTCGSATLEWRLSGRKQHEYWAEFCFASERKSLTEVRFRFLESIPGP